MNLTPTLNGIIFEFYDDSTSTRFVNRTASGIAIAISAKDQANVDRWGVVKAIGPDVHTVKVGEAILVESGYWTASFETEDDTKYWKTDEDHVILTADEPQGIY
jgi:co-chaperonin GroES (HSP10)